MYFLNLLMDIWGIFSFRLSWIVVLGTLQYMSSDKQVNEFLLSKSLWVEW